MSSHQDLFFCNTCLADIDYYSGFQSSITSDIYMSICINYFLKSKPFNYNELFEIHSYSESVMQSIIDFLEMKHFLISHETENEDLYIKPLGLHVNGEKYLFCLYPNEHKGSVCH